MGPVRTLGLVEHPRSLGAFTLVGCTVSPGFDFAGFELAPPAWTPGPVTPDGRTV